MTPIALISSFLREHMPIEQGCSPHTCETYAHAFRLLFIFASKRLGIRPSQICLEQIDAALILEFLAHIEEERGNCGGPKCAFSPVFAGPGSDSDSVKFRSAFSVAVL